MIGVLALQGGFAEHIHMLNKIGIDSFEIRQKADLENKEINGLILPGGESTVIGKLLHELNLFVPLKKMIHYGIPTFGTCAGLILLAKDISDDNTIHIGEIDIIVKRNAFGRQMGSFSTNDPFADIPKVPMIFIRAPYIEKADDDVEILSRVNGHIVAVKQNNILATAFHPELTNDIRVHEYFIEKIVKSVI